MIRVVILMAQAGGGHRSVSLALKDALLSLGPPQTEVVIADLMALSRPGLVDQAVRLYGPVIRHAPAVYGGVYHLSEHPLVYPAVRAQTHHTFTNGVKQLLREKQPSVVISTYPLGNRAVVDALDELGTPAPALALVTELVSVHPSWAEPGFTHWTTATDEAREAVIRLGAPRERVVCLGLPVNERFGRVTSSPAEIRRQFGLEPDRTTVLVVGGAEGAGRLHRLVPALAAGNPETQLIVVCGYNGKARSRLAAMSLPVPAAILGFVDCMPELMHAADLVVTKGGPQTIVEVLCSGRAIVVFDTLPGQEEGNTEFVERHRVGLDGRTLARALDAVQRLIAGPASRLAMGERARALARPDAARATAALVLSLAGEAGVSVEGRGGAVTLDGDGAPATPRGKDPIPLGEG